MSDFFEELIKTTLGYVISATDSVFGKDGAKLQFGNSFLSLSNKLWGYLSLVAIGLTLIYFLIELNRKLALEGGDFNMKSMFSPFLKLMIAIAILSQGATIFSTILDLNNSFVKEASSYDITELDTGEATDGKYNILNDDQREEFAKELADKTSGLIVTVFACVAMLLMYLITLVLNLVWFYKACMFKIEFLWRIGITPIGLTDIYSGNNSNAIRWCKGTLALAVYGMGLVVLPKLALVLMADSFTLAVTGGFWNCLASIASCIIAPLAALGSASAVKQISKEALG